MKVAESKMHRLKNMDIKNSVNKYVDNVVIDNLNKWIDIYNKMNKDSIYEYADKGILHLTKYEIFMKIISNCPMGLEKWMNISTNYMQLKNILLQRDGHRLQEDWTNFRQAILDLPYFKELTGVDR